MAVLVWYHPEVICSGGRVLRIIGNVQRFDAPDFCDLEPAVPSLPHAHSTRTTGTARILRISPRLPPYSSTSSSVDQNAEAFIPTTHRSFSLFLRASFSHMIYGRLH